MSSRPRPRSFPMLSRREVLRAGAVAAGAAVAAPLAAAAPPRQDVYARERFLPLVGTEFSASLEGATGGPVPLTLVAVSEAPAARGRGFVLRFRAAPEARAPQETYLVRHAALGTFALFLVPERREGAALSLAAVINT